MPKDPLAGLAETIEKHGKNPAAVSLGKLGGKARAKSLSAAQRKLIAQKAAKARWAKSETKGLTNTPATSKIVSR